MARNFKASVQYDDYRGTAAADRGDQKDLLSFFKDKGLVGNNDFVIAIEFWSGENHGGPANELSVTLTVAELHGNKTLPDVLSDPKRAPFRSIHVDMPAGDFFGLFKRFNVVLAAKGYEEELATNEYQVEDIYPEDG